MGIENQGIALLLITAIVLGLIVYIANNDIPSEKDYNKACQYIGFYEAVWIDGSHYCLDADNNAYLVEVKCDGWLWDRECEGKLITIK